MAWTPGLRPGYGADNCHAKEPHPHFSTVLDESQPTLGVAVEADPGPILDFWDSRPPKVDHIFSEASYGGKKYAFTDHVGRMCECPVCQGVVKEAQSVRCCKKTFCKSCLDEALKRFKRCPLCRTENPATYENEAIDDGVNDLKVLCLHHGKGCEWSGHLLHEPQHREEKCGYEEVGCENQGLGCKIVAERRIMKQHLEEECVYREVPCEFCRESQRVQEMGGHLATCPERPLSCIINGCRVKGLLRKNIGTHLEVCPEALVGCPFKEMGCSVGRLKRKDMQSHTTNAVSDHLALVMNNLVETKQAMRQQADAHKTETDCLKANIEQMKVEAGDYKTQTKSLNARIDQLQTEADVHREETKAMKAHIEELQVTCKKHTLASKVKKKAQRASAYTPSKPPAWATPVDRPASCKTPDCWSPAKPSGYCDDCYDIDVKPHAYYDEY